MFTILNIINYFTGKYIPPIILVLITISVYSYILYKLLNCNVILFSTKKDQLIDLSLILVCQAKPRFIEAKFGGPGRDRTCDLPVMSRLL